QEKDLRLRTQLANQRSELSDPAYLLNVITPKGIDWIVGTFNVVGKSDDHLLPVSRGSTDKH
ncbi:MAG: hypothetical protein AAFQ16_11925, partial [Pseudomonadota bacterium]